MKLAFVATVVAAGFSAPSVRERTIVVPPPIAEAAPVEMTVDRGSVVELTVRCRNGTAIVLYSKVDRQFCAAHGPCSPNYAEAARHGCG